MENLTNNTNDKTLLSIEHLSVSFKTPRQILHAVEDVSFQVKQGEVLGVVGESGCGKSVSSMSVLRLVQGDNVLYDSGSILFEGNDTLAMTEKQLQKIRGKDISVIFQEPMTALNPLYTIGDQMGEVLKLHTKLSKREIGERCIEMLKKVKIPNAEEVLLRYPHSLSGGMRQRVMIAMALLTNPKLIIADEPTTALDVTIQAQVLDVMRSLRKEFGCSFIFITHDLGVISEMADRVIVMYGGRVCESAATDVLFGDPVHPYTNGLIASRPYGGMKTDRLPVIPGNVPSLNNKPSGCPFHPRCPKATAKCAEAFPPVTEVAPEHNVACWNFSSK